MNISFTDISTKDTDFIFNLFCNYKVSELGAEDWPEILKQQVCTLQYNAFLKSLYQISKGVDDKLVLFENTKIGRLIINYLDDEICLKYICLLPEYRNKGIGKSILNMVIKTACDLNKNISLSISKANTAFSLYEKIGFTIENDDLLEYKMIYKVKV